MASVNTVYTALKNLANKDQRGFITPAVFNSFAGVAQLNVYNSLFDKLALGNAARTRQLSGERETAPLKQIREDLARFAKESTISQTSSTDQTFAKPADLGRIISAKTFGTFVLSQTTSIPIDLIYDEAKMLNCSVTELLKNLLNAITAQARALGAASVWPAFETPCSYSIA